MRKHVRRSFFFVIISYAVYSLCEYLISDDIARRARAGVTAWIIKIYFDLHLLENNLDIPCKYM